MEGSDPELTLFKKERKEKSEKERRGKQKKLQASSELELSPHLHCVDQRKSRFSCRPTGIDNSGPKKGENLKFYSSHNYFNVFKESK